MLSIADSLVNISPYLLNDPRTHKKMLVEEINKRKYTKLNDTSQWVVRKNKQRGKTFKYVYIKSAKELLKHIPLTVNSL